VINGKLPGFEIKFLPQVSSFPSEFSHLRFLFSFNPPEFFLPISNTIASSLPTAGGKEKV
jgi:hypothetical protein